MVSRTLREDPALAFTVSAHSRTPLGALARVGEVAGQRQGYADLQRRVDDAEEVSFAENCRRPARRCGHGSKQHAGEEAWRYG